MRFSQDRLGFYLAASQVTFPDSRIIRQKIAVNRIGDYHFAGGISQVLHDLPNYPSFAFTIADNAELVSQADCDNRSIALYEFQAPCRQIRTENIIFRN